MFNGIIKNIGIITDIKKKNNNFFLAINSKMKIQFWQCLRGNEI